MNDLAKQLLENNGSPSCGSIRAASVCFEADFDLDNPRYEFYGRGDGPTVEQLQRMFRREIATFHRKTGFVITEWEIEYVDEMDGIWSCLLVGNLRGPFDITNLKEADLVGTESESWYVTVAGEDGLFYPASEFC